MVAAHAVTLSAYALIGAGVAGMVRARRAGMGDGGALLDGALVAVAGWIVVWSFLVVPAVAAGADVGAQIVNGAYPTASVVIGFLLAQLAVTQAHRAPAYRILAVALSSVLVGDVVYAAIDAGYFAVDPAVVDAAYAAAFLGAAAAALHPSMRALTDPQPVRPRAMGTGRLGAVSSALVAPIAAAAVRPPSGALQWGMLVGASVAVMALVLNRIVRAVNQHAASEARLTHQATHDALTGLANRSHLLVALDEALDAARAGGRGVAVLFLDVDRFKAVNDTWGHSVGDRLLTAVGERLLRPLRPGDVLARVGGDEFVVAAPGVGSPDAARSLAARLAAELVDELDLGVCRVRVSASVGVLHTDGLDGTTAEDLLRDADIAMYRAKEDGGAIATFDAGMRADVARRVDLETALDRVAERDELRLFHQPVVELGSGRLVGFEALLRWERPGVGLVPPLEFIPVAEDTGAIVDIGRWVLEEGCRQLAAWDDELGLDRRLTLAVNLSARQLRDPDLVDAVAGALMRAGVAPERLVLEITESVMLEDTGVDDVLGALRDLGVRLAADDFGTGYSSLSYLKRYPIGQVKIDRSFVAGLGVDPDDEGIVAAILAMARALDLEVVAEGIETDVQRRRLQALGCDHAQGYLFAAPLPPAAARALLERATADGWVPWEETGETGGAALPPEPRATPPAPASGPGPVPTALLR
jgi:diguanylate cyclase (GGDEF)-like protein